MDRIACYSSNLKFSVAEPTDYDSVLAFVIEHYYKDEPMNSSYIYDSSPAVDDVEFSVSFLLQGMAVKAVDPSCENQLVGVSIANPINQEYVNDLLEAAKQAKTEKWRDSLKLLAHLQQTVNVLQRFNVPKCYDIEIVAVHPDYRGQSIGSRLFEEQFARAKQLGYAVASADCSSYYSARIAEKVGMECVARLPYSDYRDERGVQLFQPKAPHVEIQTFVKLLH
ncbi:arylalkylamine N-acetyltransferase 1-like [Armigeres subalbatus]|uniref:arylalkylamine N-acetyltransferase 1-like n=1 Tax=Armigeres subalbatus TaxID=124917 RepID=UPI002ED2B52E